MRTWHYAVSPDIVFAVRTTRSKPELLSRTFGPQVEHDQPAVLELQLGGARGSDADAATVRGVYKAIPWTCGVAIDGDRLLLTFQSVAMREYLAMHVALLPALRFLLARRNVGLVLGAAYEIGGAATVLSGPTGTGKTSLLLGALGRGARFVGDEYIGLMSESRVSAVVRSLALRRSTLELAPEAADWMSGSRGLALRAAEIMTKVTGGRLEPLNHVRPEDLGWNVVEGAVPIERFVWLASDATTGKPTLEPMAVEDVVQHLSLKQAEHQVAYGDITPYLDAAAEQTDTNSQWREALNAALGDTKCLRLSFSRRTTAAALALLFEEGAA